MFPAGTLVDEKYRVERFLGQGDMGCVFLATQVFTGESLALKVLYPTDPAQGPAAFAAFLVAARAAARFRSEHVAYVRDMGLLEDGGPFLVMDYFEGITLETHLRARGPLAIGDAVGLALQAAQGLCEAHDAGVVHRDAKPSNWLLTETLDGAMGVKLLDFGAAKIAPRARSTEEPSPTWPGQVGWIPYAAPEQIRGPAGVDERADVWTVGVVLHEMLTGTTPSGWGTMRQARDGALAASRPWRQRQAEGPISAQLEAVVRRCLERRRENRFADMADLVLALAPLQARVAQARAAIEPSAIAAPVSHSSSLAPVSVAVPGLSESVAPTMASVASMAGPASLIETPGPAAAFPWQAGAGSRVVQGSFSPEPTPTAPAAPPEEPVDWTSAGRLMAWLPSLALGRLVVGSAVLGIVAGAVFFLATRSEEANPALGAPGSAIATMNMMPEVRSIAPVAPKAVAPAEPSGVASPSASSSPVSRSAEAAREAPVVATPLPEPRPRKTAPRPSANKTQLAQAPPVGTAGFGDRE